MKVLVIFLLIVAPSFATNLTQLYEADIVTTRTKLDEHDFKKALKIVINRLTPGPNDLDNPILQTANPKKLLDSVRPQTLNKKNQTLRVLFKPNAINQLLEDAGHQPWITNRPKLLTVVMLINSRTKILISPTDHPDIYKSLDRSAAEKGLQLVYPDPGQLEMIGKAVYSNNERKILLLERGSASLKPEALLYIELQSSDDTSDYWEYAQVYYKKRNEYTIDNLRTKPDQVGRYTMTFASSFLFKQGEERDLIKNSIYVSIGNIQTVNDYHLVADYIEHIPGVMRASINSVTADAVLYTLDISVPPILLDQRLAKKYTPLPGNPDEGIMHYRLKT